MEYSKFFNAVEIAPGVYDRVYEESDFADYFGSVLSNGLLHLNNIPGLDVTVESNTLNTVVAPGKAIIEGHLYANTTPLTLTHNMPEALYDRIDRIVLRLDSRNQARYIRLFVKEGQPSANPVGADLQRDAFIYELCIAEVRIRANTSTIQQADVLDTRLDDVLCGLTYSLISGPLGDMTANIVRIIDAKSNFRAKTVEEALAEMSEPLSVTKTGLDVNGIFTTIVWRNSSGVKVKQSVLSEPNADFLYRRRIVTIYDQDGTTPMKTTVYNISYNSDGAITGEVAV